jgi:hypothetical protein
MSIEEIKATFGNIKDFSQLWEIKHKLEINNFKV